MTVTYRKATVDDAVALFPRLRVDDLREVTLSSGNNVEASLVKAVEVSEVCLCAEDEEGIICLWGIARHDSSRGSIWMLAADSVYKYTKELIGIKPWVHSMLPHYGTLYNYVHADNKRSIRWLKMLGFKFGELIPDYGVGKAPFYPFYLIQE